jgi:hypothetical protein
MIPDLIEPADPVPARQRGMRSMRAYRYTGPRKAELSKIPVSEPGVGEGRVDRRLTPNYLSPM